MPQIDVTFEIDANGIVNVSAKDKMTGLEQAMQITPSSGLAPDEIEKLIVESETMVDEDRQSKELILQKNRLETLIKNTQKAMSEFGASLSEEDQKTIAESVTKATMAMGPKTLMKCGWPCRISSRPPIF